MPSRREPPLVRDGEGEEADGRRVEEANGMRRFRSDVLNVRCKASLHSSM